MNVFFLSVIIDRVRACISSTVLVRRSHSSALIFTVGVSSIGAISCIAVISSSENFLPDFKLIFHILLQKFFVRELVISAFTERAVLVSRLAVAGVGDVLAVVLPPNTVAELFHHRNKFLAVSASLHCVLDGGTQTELPALTFTARTVLACAYRFCFALTEGRENRKSVRQTNFVVDVTQSFDVISVLVELLAGVGMHRVNDKMVVHVVAIEMKRNHHAVSRPRATGELQAHLDHFLGIDVLVGVEGLHVVSEAQSVGLIPDCFVCHEFLISNFGITVNARHTPRFFGRASLFGLKAVRDHRMHHARKVVCLIRIFDFYECCHVSFLLLASV